MDKLPKEILARNIAVQEKLVGETLEADTVRTHYLDVARGDIDALQVYERASMSHVDTDTANIDVVTSGLSDTVDKVARHYALVEVVSTGPVSTALSLGTWLNAASAGPLFETKMANNVQAESEYVVIPTAGIWKVDVSVTLTHSVQGQVHSCEIGIGTDMNLPASPLATCTPNGTDLPDGCAASTLVECGRNNTILRLYVRDVTYPSADITIDRGQIVLTKIGI